MIRKFIPAIPTIAIALILAKDFDGLMHSLYLLAPVIFYGSFIFGVGLLLFLLVKTRTARNPYTAAVLILVTGMILLPLLEKPVASTLKNTTALNRTFAVVKKVYQKDDVFEFTITAQGSGSKDNFSLDSGYANISINSNHYSGPSLYYDLRPTVVFRDHNVSAPISAASVATAFKQNQMGQISTPEYTSSFKNILEKLARIDSKESFDAEFGGEPGNEIELSPYKNAVYRVSFLIISLIAMAISFVLYKPSRVETSKEPNKSLEATS